MSVFAKLAKPPRGTREATEARIMSWLRSHPGAQGLKDIAIGVDFTPAYVHDRIHKLIKDGHVAKLGRGVYAHKTKEAA